MSSIFASESDFDLDAIELLKNYQFIDFIYHPSGEGHVQVEIPLTENLCSLSRLIEVIDHKKAWPSCMQMLSNQSDQWLLSFSTELQNEQSKSITQCLVKLTNFLQCVDNKVCHIQESPLWYWQAELLPLLVMLIQQLDEIEGCLPINAQTCLDFEHEILKQTRNKLLRIKLDLQA